MREKCANRDEENYENSEDQEDAKDDEDVEGDLQGDFLNWSPLYNLWHKSELVLM